MCLSVPDVQVGGQILRRVRREQQDERERTAG
jgi:hypothetical protein